MNERYVRLFLLKPNLYAETSPVIIAAGALLKDNLTGGILAQLKIRNIGTKPIKAATVRLHPCDTIGKPLGNPLTHQYLDLMVLRDQDFGAKTPLLFADPTTRGYQAEVTEVIFADNTLWSGTAHPWEPLSGPGLVRDQIGEIYRTLPVMDEQTEKRISHYDLVNAYQRRFGAKCQYTYTEIKDLWFCACGALNRQGETECYICHNAAQNIRVTPELVQDLKRQRVESVRTAIREEQRRAEEQRRRAEEQRLRQEEERRRTEEARARAEELRAVLQAQKAERNKKRNKKLKVWAIVLSVLIVLGVGGYFGTMAVINAIETEKANQALYDTAVSYYEQGDYDAAIERFAALGGYKDSAAQLAIAQEAKNEEIYRQAIEAAQNNNFNKATELFTSLGDYKDSKEKLENLDELWKEARYQEALECLADGRFSRAHSLFEKLGDYKDCKQQLNRFYTVKIDSVDGGTREVLMYREEE